MSLKEESGRFFFHFREIFEKCIEYIVKFLIHFREILYMYFGLKRGTFSKNFNQFYGSFPGVSLDDEGGITCMCTDLFYGKVNIGRQCI